MQNEPAFPVDCDWTSGDLRGVQTSNSGGWATGITMRDYFAAKALPTFLDLVPTEVWNQGLTGKPGKLDNAMLAAKAAYAAADAMLKVRLIPSPEGDTHG